MNLFLGFTQQKSHGVHGESHQERDTALKQSRRGAFGFQLEKWKLHRCLTHLQVFAGTRPKTIAIVRTSLRDAMLLETFAFVAIQSLVIGWSWSFLFNYIIWYMILILIICIIITIELPTIIIDLSNSLLARFSIETSWQQDGRDDHFWKGALFHTFWGFPKSRVTAHYHLSYWKTNTHSNFEGLTARLKALSANVATDHHPVCPANKQLIFLSKSSKASHVKEGCIYI